MARIGGTRCASWVGDTAEALYASRGLRPEEDAAARADGSGRRSARQRREREGASGQSNTKNNRSRGLVEWA